MLSPSSQAATACDRGSACTVGCPQAAAGPNPTWRLGAVQSQPAVRRPRGSLPGGGRQCLSPPACLCCQCSPWLTCPSCFPRQRGCISALRRVLPMRCGCRASLPTAQGGPALLGLQGPCLWPGTACASLPGGGSSRAGGPCVPRLCLSSKRTAMRRALQAPAAPSCVCACQGRGLRELQRSCAPHTVAPCQIALAPMPPSRCLLPLCRPRAACCPADHAWECEALFTGVDRGGAAGAWGLGASAGAVLWRLGGVEQG